MTKSLAMLLILIGAVCMSFAALFVRLIDQADGFQILAYRSISLAGTVGIIICMRRKSSPLRIIGTIGSTDWCIGVVLSLAFTTYVFALLNTSVASALFILASAPLIAAILSWIWISERPSLIVCLTIFFAGIGITIMAGKGIALGQTTGNLLALASATLFAIMLVIARYSGKDDVLGGTFLGGVLSCGMAAICAITIGDGLYVSLYDLMTSLFMGAFTIGIGITLVTWGTPFVPAAEVSLLVLLESVLSPIWVWIFLGEVMTPHEILGGSVVLLSVTGLTLTSIAKSR